MPTFDTSSIVLIAITLFAATVNGALGYGFSSLTVPVALLFYTSRVLNPTMVIVEVAINFAVLFMNRESIPKVYKRLLPIVIGLIPGVLVGSHLLASLHPAWIKLVTYTFLLPLIFVQAAGIRRPIQAERAIGLPFGAGIGFLYSVTTISGPPLAVLFNNQGLAKKDFRAALGLIRVAESSMTAIAYYNLGLFDAHSRALVPLIVPSVLVGIPLGTALIRRLDAETFRRICMSFDVWVVSFGLSRVIVDLKMMRSPANYLVIVGAMILDAYLLYVFFTRRARRIAAERRPAAVARAANVPPPDTPVASARSDVRPL
jgi:uncharacterized membrane protein YfcA